jgi:hypothetical protein
VVVERERTGMDRRERSAALRPSHTTRPAGLTHPADSAQPAPLLARPFPSPRGTAPRPLTAPLDAPCRVRSRGGRDQQRRLSE